MTCSEGRGGPLQGGHQSPRLISSGSRCRGAGASASLWAVQGGPCMLIKVAGAVIS